MENVFDVIIQKKDELPLKQRKLCEYILKNSSEVYLMTVGELSVKSSVGRATVMRLIESLGYESFSGFKKALSAACIERFTDKDMDQPFVWSGEPDNRSSITSCFTESVDLIRKTHEMLDLPQFDAMVSLMLDARQVNVVGFRTSSALSKHFCYHLEPLLGRVKDLGDSESMAFDRVLRFTSGEILVIIAAVPVTAAVVEVAKLCQELKIPVLLITDSPTSPVLPYASAHLCVPVNTNKRWSVIPFIAVFEALVSEIGLRTAPISVRTLNRRDEYLLGRNIVLY